MLRQQRQQQVCLVRDIKQQLVPNLGAAGATVWAGASWMAWVAA